MTAALADPDGDGQANLVEFALGADPLDPAGRGAVSLGLVRGGGGELAIELSYRPALNFPGAVTYLPESSSDLVTWTPAGRAPNVSVEEAFSNDGTRRVTVREDVPADGGERRFLRLRVVMAVSP